MEQSMWFTAVMVVTLLLALWALSLRWLAPRFEAWQAALPLLVIVPLMLFFALGVDASRRTGYAVWSDVLGTTLWILLWMILLWGGGFGLLFWYIGRVARKHETPDGEGSADEG